MNNEVKYEMSLRPYACFIADMEANVNRDIAEYWADEKQISIRELYAQFKHEGINLYGLHPVKKDRRKILNRYKKRKMREADESYSRAVSSQSGKANV